MTVIYTNDLSKINICTVLLILFRWRGSVFKLVLFEAIVFFTIYAALSMIYRFIRYNEHPRAEFVFSFLSLYCTEIMNKIPVAFVLGFYVSIVINWWSEQFKSLPWPDDLALQLSAFLQGDTDEIVLLRRTIVRYVNMSMIIAFRGISKSTRRLYGNLEAMREAGLMNTSELQALQSIDRSYNKYYVPIVWAANMIRDARRRNLISEDRQLDVLVETLTTIRGTINDLFVHQWIIPPLVYTQVATITVYCYFMAALMSWQFVSGKDDYYIPFFGMLQFVFYMGWLKVAENLINPFGEKDDDFDLTYLIERNVQIAYLIVDDMRRAPPEIVKDKVWNEEFEKE